MKLEISKERVLEAASKCSTAKETLKTLFPEVFEDEKYFDFRGVDDIRKISNVLAGSLVVRGGGNYNRRGFYLSSEFNWEIITDDKESLVLVPTKKTQDEVFLEDF